MSKFSQIVPTFVLAGLLSAGVGVGASLVSAQTDTQTGAQNSSVAETSQPKVQGRNGFGGFGGHSFGGHGFGARGFGGPGFGGSVALGSSLTYTFYDGDPAAGGSVTDTLTFTSGEDSEAAFAQTLQTAREAASFAVIQTSEQTRTLDVSGLDTATVDNWRGRGLSFLGRGLNDGSTVTVSFYDSDPESGAAATQTLSFTYAQDSEAGFADDVQTALENAGFVTVTISPQERTVDLSQQALDQGGFRGHGDQNWDGQNRGGPGRGRWGNR